MSVHKGWAKVVSHITASNHTGSFPQMAGFVSSVPAGESSSGMTCPTPRSTAAATYSAEHTQARRSTHGANAASCVRFDSPANRSIKDISGGLTRRALLIQG